MTIYDIIKKPVYNTEKTRDLLAKNEYTFFVDRRANKLQIAQAVEKLFNVKVLNVNTITVKGKEKRVGRSIGKTADWKKAVVTIDTNPTEKTYLEKGGKQVKVSKKYKDSIEHFMGA